MPGEQYRRNNAEQGSGSRGVAAPELLLPLTGGIKVEDPGKWLASCEVAAFLPSCHFCLLFKSPQVLCTHLGRGGLSPRGTRDFGG